MVDFENENIDKQRNQDFQVYESVSYKLSPFLLTQDEIIPVYVDRIAKIQSKVKELLEKPVINSDRDMISVKLIFNDWIKKERRLSKLII